MLLTDFTVFFDEAFWSVLRVDEPDRRCVDLEATFFATFFLLLLLLRFLAAVFFTGIAEPPKTD
jgi:hypothetical protein